MDELRSFIQSQMQSNQFLVGGFVLGALAGLIHWCKAIPRRVWTWIKCRFIIEIDIPDRDEAFQWLNKWLALHPYGAKRARLLTVRTERPDSSRPTSVNDDEPQETQPKIIFSPAAGYHYFFYKRRLVILERERKDGSEAKNGMFTSSIRESFNIKIVARDRQMALQLLEEARELVHPKGVKKISILSPQYGNWEVNSKCRPRPLSSVMLKTGIMEDLLSQIEHFLSREDWYHERGIPWRLGVLLKGPPGSGKSSSVVALASHFNLDIAILSLGGSGLSDNGLRDLLGSIPNDTLILIEDVDCVFNQRKATKDESKVTFSGLLNAIDGVAAGEGRVLFMTTNHPEKLDPALIRPGRADIQIYVGEPDAGQCSRMFERFFPQSTSSQNLKFIEALPKKKSMASIQAHLTKYSDDAEAAIRHAAEAALHPETQL